MQTHLAAIALANRHSFSQCTPSGPRAWPMSLSPLKSSQTAPQPSTTHMQPSLAFATYQTRSPLAPTCMHAYTLSNQINQSWLISVHATHYT